MKALAKRVASGLTFRASELFDKGKIYAAWSGGHACPYAIATPYKFRGSLAINYLVGCSYVQCNANAQAWKVRE